MNAQTTCRFSLLFSALTIFLLATERAQAGTPSKSPKVSIADAELDAHGTWRGVVVTPQGTPVARAELTLRSGNHSRTTVATLSDDQGRFRFQNLRPGTYALQTGKNVRVYRLWHFGTAPPSVAKASLVVAGEDLQRGKLYDWAAAHPVITYTGLAAAIVTPVAVLGTEDSTPASP